MHPKECITTTTTTTTTIIDGVEKDSKQYKPPLTGLLSNLFICSVTYSTIQRFGISPIPLSRSTELKRTNIN